MGIRLGEVVEPRDAGAEDVLRGGETGAHDGQAAGCGAMADDLPRGCEPMMVEGEISALPPSRP